ncbi:NADP-dependent glyceraldehyde-3-phosphate dehydrogenase [Cellulosilyticum ruminicola]|uniref:NADP-dependent glyceraldehyde-3-phosphate dehydrogenase n=1 Tax=Cellulosilyticum ruminicola TaxID=425254 RepID=UPI0006D15C5A|nr:NADP-dependent glyceraldehyde-3-phosphate dehydrogenase [Cellulosilyticum ruminicola]
MIAKQFIDIKSPLTDEVIGKVPAMSREDVDEIIQRAKNGFKIWRDKPLHERVEYLYKVAELLLEHEVELTSLLIKEVGKDQKSAKSEVVRTADLIKFTADTAKNMHGQNINADSFPGGNKGKFAIIKHVPIGVVLAVSPFNYPVNLAASKIAPALVSGNAVVFKPATQGSLSGSFLAKLFIEVGLPEGVLGIVTGKGSQIGDYIVTHCDINFINFTGSTEVGNHIAKEAKMVPLLMELGGKDAAVVLEDADLDLTASHIVGGAFAYSGQRCTAIKRVIVVNEVADALAEKIKEQMKKLKVGNPVEIEGTLDVVPLINEGSADFVEGLIEEAKIKGAKLLCGGERKGNLITPTLFDYVTTDMRLAWEEPFGPVLPIIRVNSEEEAIQITNASEYGLQASVFTTNMHRAFEVADKLEVGTVQINNKTERGPDHLPFLGVKSSGIGVQGISYSIEAMTRIKSTVINL